MRKVKPMVESSLVPAALAPPPLHIIDGRPEERSWIPASDILNPALIQDFYHSNPDESGPSSASPWEGGYCHVSFP